MEVCGWVCGGLWLGAAAARRALEKERRVVNRGPSLRRLYTIIRVGRAELLEKSVEGAARGRFYTKTFTEVAGREISVVRGRPGLSEA